GVPNSFEAQGLDQLLGSLLSSGGLQPTEGKTDISLDVQMLEKRAALCHVANFPVLRWNIDAIGGIEEHPTGERDVAGLWPQQSANGFQSQGFPRTGGAQQRQESRRRFESDVELELRQRDGTADGDRLFSDIRIRRRNPRERYRGGCLIRGGGMSRASSHLPGVEPEHDPRGDRPDEGQQ